MYCANWSDAQWRISWKGLPISTKYSSPGTTRFWLRVFNQHLTPLVTWIGASNCFIDHSINTEIMEFWSHKAILRNTLLFLGYFWWLLIPFKKSQWWCHAVLPRDMFLLPLSLTALYWGSTAQHCNSAFVGGQIFLDNSNKNHCRLQLQKFKNDAMKIQNNMIYPSH